MRTLKDFKFNDDEKQLVSSIINRYGTGDHPVCGQLSFNFFTARYLEEIILYKYGEIKRNLTKEGNEIFESILNHF